VGRWLVIQSRSIGIGPYANGTDASSFGNLQNGTNILPGGQLQYASGYGYYTLAPGGTVRNVSGTYYNGGMQIDQLPGRQWFEVIGPVNNTNRTFYIKCSLGHPVTSTCPTLVPPSPTSLAAASRLREGCRT
jgi:hypothetical protein